MKSTGTIKWFNPTKGYGFISPDNNKNDVFIHISALQAAGLDDVENNQKIEFEIIKNKGRESAANIKIL